MDTSLFSKYKRNIEKHKKPLAERTAKESLINQIVESTTEKNKANLAKLIAIHANRYSLTEMDLHALLNKKHDPKIRNFTAFVKWSIKDSKK